MIFLNKDIEKALTSYLGAKGLDEKTQSKYLEFYHKFANVHGQLTQETLDEFLKYNDYNSSRAMVRHLLDAIKRWEFPMEMKEVVIRLDIPKSTGKKEKKEPLHLDFKELEYLINHMNGNSWTDERNRLSILTQWWGGLRVTELLGIGLPDLETDKYDKNKSFQKIKIRAKTAKFRKERYTYVPTNIYFRVIEYIKRRSQIGSFNKKLNEGGNIWGFSNSAYDKLLRKKTKAILGRSYNTHSLRHGRATDLIKKGVPIEKIRLLLGHENIGSTQVYVHLSQSDIEESLK